MKGSRLTHLDLVREFRDTDTLGSCLLETASWAYNADHWDTTHEACPKFPFHESDAMAVAKAMDWFVQLSTDNQHQFIHYVRVTMYSKQDKAAGYGGSGFNKAITETGPLLLRLLHQVVAGEKYWLVKHVPSPAGAEQDDVPVHASISTLIVID